MRKKIIIFLLVALVAILAATTLFKRNDTKDEVRVTADTFMDKIVALDTKASYAMLTTSMQDNIAPEKWGTAIKATFEGHNAIPIFVSRSSDGSQKYKPASNAQKFTYKLDFGTTQPNLYIIIVKDGDSLKVAEMHSDK